MDKKYWNKYYKNHGEDIEISKPSSFAQFINKEYLQKKKFKIVELGSGNGRDAIYFANLSHNVIALDQSIQAIENKKKNLHKNINKFLHPKAVDFINEDYNEYNKIDIFYSRFSLHSITKKDEIILLPKIYNSLNRNGLLCIEVRTTKDPLFGIGQQCGQNTFMHDNHKRRFIESTTFRVEAQNLGFKELFFIEKDNLSIYKNDNPVLMRIILQK